MSGGSNARALEQLAEAPPGVGIVLLPGAQQLVGLGQAAHLCVGGRTPSQVLERASQRRGGLPLVLERGQELARQRVPHEHLHVVAAQQERPFPLPTHPLERRLGRLRPVMVPLAEYRDRVAKRALCQLDRHRSGGRSRYGVHRHRPTAALVLALAATPAGLVARRRPALTGAGLALELDEGAARAAIRGIVALGCAPRGVALEVDRHDHEWPVTVGAPAPQRALHAGSALGERLIDPQAGRPPGPALTRRPLVLIGHPHDARRTPAYRDSRTPRRRAHLSHALVMTLGRLGAERLDLALERIGLAAKTPQAEPPGVGHLVDDALAVTTGQRGAQPLAKPLDRRLVAATSL